MGLQILRNHQGLYQLTSTITDERLHPEEWVPATVAKSYLISRRLQAVMQEVIEIDMNFPYQYQVNGKFVMGVPAEGGYHEFMQELIKAEDFGKALTTAFVQILEKYEMQEWLTLEK